MTEYNLIFGAVLLFNVAVTFRASSYWKAYFPGAVAASDAASDAEVAPLATKAGGDAKAGVTFS